MNKKLVLVFQNWMTLLFVLLFCTVTLRAQTVVLEIDEQADSVVNNFGPNRTHFVHTFFSLGFPVGNQLDGANIELVNSTNFKFGLRYKLKISEFLSAGLDLAYVSLDYRLKQEHGKIVPDTTMHDKENLLISSLEGSFFLRMNLGQRGDFMGRFIGIGAAYGYKIGSNHVTRDKLPTGEIQKIYLSKLKYLNAAQTYVFIRLGLNRLIFNFEYRLTDLFKAANSYPEFPPYTIGIQFGLH